MLTNSLQTDICIHCWLNVCTLSAGYIERDYLIIGPTFDLICLCRVWCAHVGSSSHIRGDVLLPIKIILSVKCLVCHMEWFKRSWKPAIGRAVRPHMHTWFCQSTACGMFVLPWKDGDVIKRHLCHPGRWVGWGSERWCTPTRRRKKREGQSWSVAVFLFLLLTNVWEEIPELESWRNRIWSLRCASGVVRWAGEVVRLRQRCSQGYHFRVRLDTDYFHASRHKHFTTKSFVNM